MYFCLNMFYNKLIQCRRSKIHQLSAIRQLPCTLYTEMVVFMTALNRQHEHLYIRQYILRDIGWISLHRRPQPFHLLHYSFKMEFISIAFAVYLCQDHFIIIIPQRSRQLVICHVHFLFLFTPFSSYFIWINHSELSKCRLPSYTSYVLVRFFQKRK